MANEKSYRDKFYSGLHLFVQSFLVLLLLSVMVIWALLLLVVVVSPSGLYFAHDNTLIALSDANTSTPNNANASNALFQQDANITQTKVFQITNLAIPELFAFIGLFAVILSNIYWSATSGLILFVFWILDHQRFPTLLGWTTTNSTEVLFVIGHVLHLITWNLLLLYGGLLTLLRHSNEHKLTRTLARRPPLAPVYCQNGTNYCGADAPPYYDTFPPPPTFETIQIRSTRGAPNVN